MRKRIFEIIEVSSGGDCASTVYDVSMMVVIIASLVPLAFKAPGAALTALDRGAAYVFILDYALRLWTADFKVRRGVLCDLSVHADGHHRSAVYLAVLYGACGRAACAEGAASVPHVSRLSCLQNVAVFQEHDDDP